MAQQASNSLCCSGWYWILAPPGSTSQMWRLYTRTTTSSFRLKCWLLWPYQFREWKFHPSSATRVGTLTMTLLYQWCNTTGADLGTTGYHLISLPSVQWSSLLQRWEQWGLKGKSLSKVAETDSGWARTEGCAQCDARSSYPVFIFFLKTRWVQLG